MALPNRSKPGSLGGVPGKSWNDPTFERDYPSIFAFLHDDTYSDGKPRKPGTISMFCKAGVLTLAVNDHDRMVVAFVNEATWEECLFVLEEGIAKDSLSWREQRGTTSREKPPF